MGTIFTMVLTMSLEAVFVGAVVLFLRFFFYRLPKSYTCALWVLVLFRLLCPVTISTGISLMPDLQQLPLLAEPRQPEAAGPALETPAALPSEPGMQTTPFPAAEPSAKAAPASGSGLSQPGFWDVWAGRLGLLWALGAASLTLLYLLGYISWYRQTGRHRKKGQAIVEEAAISEPYVSGILHPVIYLPAGMPDQERAHILAHEQMHIRHRDPLLRLFWQAALILHWFNPFVWLFLSLVQKDMEMYCDESVLRLCSGCNKRAYAMTLLHFSARRSGLPFPMAFGESNTESRIKHILKVKRPALAISLAAVCLIAAAAALFLTDPAVKKPSDLSTSAAEQTPEQTETDNAEINLTELFEAAQQWAQAFVARDGEAMAALTSSKELMAEYRQSDGSYTVGFSSPWPWEDDFSINCSGKRPEAIITYYARTSDPAVYAWKQKVTFLPAAEGGYRVSDWETASGPVDSAASFRDRYHFEDPEEYVLSSGQYGPYRFVNTPLDVYADSRGDILLLQEKEQSGTAPLLLEPESAALWQLNLEGGTAERLESIGENTVCLQWAFEDGKTDVIMLERLKPYRDASETDSSLWVVTNIIEESGYRQLLTSQETLHYYQSSPSALETESLQGQEGLTEALQQTQAVLKLAAFPEAQIGLYGLFVLGEPKGILLKQGEQVSCLNLDFISPQSLLPVAQKADYDGDGQAEIALVTHTDTGTEWSVEHLYLLEEGTDHTWTATEYPAADYQAQLAAELSCSYQADNGILTYALTDSGETLGSEPVEELLAGADYDGVSFENIVRFIPTQDSIWMEIHPRIGVQDSVIGAYGTLRLRARVHCSGTDFRLESYRMTTEEMPH